MGEKTIEELQQELTLIRKQNLERELELERAKIVQVEELKKKENDKKLREQIRDELVAEMSNKSNIQGGKTEVVGRSGVVEKFKADYIVYANNDLKFQKGAGRANTSEMNVFRGRSYEEILRDLKNGVKRGR